MAFTFVAASGTESVEISRNGRLWRSSHVERGGSVGVPLSSDRFQLWRIGYGTEGVRTQAEVSVVLGPVAGECIVPHVALSVTTTANA